jgi:hypothetical protein
MKTGVTETLFIASFIMTALISIKVIDNKDKAIQRLVKMHKEDSTINAINLSNHIKDSITISQMPPVEYLDFLKRNKK